jgi:putative intracellular protease/amidase
VGDLAPSDFDGLILAGGHAPGKRQYLGSAVLQAKVGEFWTLERPIGAICHGVLVLARTRDPRSGRPVIEQRQPVRTAVRGAARTTGARCVTACPVRR